MDGILLIFINKLENQQLRQFIRFYAGENSVVADIKFLGITWCRCSVNALSEHLEVTVSRNGKKFPTV